jgi:SAM-dependent methyltransferase
MNLRHCPATVTEGRGGRARAVPAGCAEEAASQAQVPVHVVDAVADALPLEDGASDAPVASLELCTVLDQPRALAELHRVIRPGGELRSRARAGEGRSTRRFST